VTLEEILNTRNKWKKVDDNLTGPYVSFAATKRDAMHFKS
jgi:hypothetical protein